TASMATTHRLLGGRLGSNGGTSAARASTKHTSQTTIEPTATLQRILGSLLTFAFRIGNEFISTTALITGTVVSAKPDPRSHGDSTALMSCSSPPPTVRPSRQPPV